MTRRVLKWTVPVDDEWHPIGSGPVVLAACQFGVDAVQVWTDEHDDGNVLRRNARIYGTGHELPPFGQHLGSVMTVGGALVWHVYADIPIILEGRK